MILLIVFLLPTVANPLLIGDRNLFLPMDPRCSPQNYDRLWHLRETNRACKLNAGGVNDEIDLFDYFDPLLSPHFYSHGIGPHNPMPSNRSNVDSSSPLGFRLPLSDLDDIASADDSLINRKLTDVMFDPTLSPHLYPHGTPNDVVGDTVIDERVTSQAIAFKKPRVGILLIDHGSRNPNSNQRLHDLAKLYQQRFEDTSVVVAAAHMEIAEPSIRDGLCKLQNENVNEIICHPFFLSPGRHVTIDIPLLVKAAVDELGLESAGISIVTTDPVGSRTDIMLTAIDGIVQESSNILHRLRHQAS
jgi:hypothetical protein